MSVSNGQIANQTTFNTAFLSRTDDSATVAKIDLLDTDPTSGADIANIQREINGVATFTGRTLGDDYDQLPVWENNDVGASSDNLQERAEALTEKFNASTGHMHTGAAGDAPAISAADLSGVKLKGSFVQGANLFGVTGTTLDVSAQLAGKTESSGITAKGVVTASTNNVVVLRDYTFATWGDQFKSALGDIVYARLTKSGAVWLLSFYTNVSNVETAFTFTGQDVSWFYQELFNPITDAPVYSELASIPSDNITQDVVAATTSQAGKVILASAAAASIAAANSAGTANGLVANADHAHAGVLSVAKAGSSAIQGAATFTGGRDIALTQAASDISMAVLEGITATATSGSITTLTASSTTNQRFTGGSAETVKLPDATTLTVGRRFRILNRSTEDVIVSYNDNTGFATIEAGNQADLMVTSIGTSNGTWDIAHSGPGSSGTDLTLQAFCFADGTGTPVGCSDPTLVGGKTRVVLDVAYSVGVTAGYANGALRVLINGQKIPRYIDATLTPNASYTEVNSTTIDLDTDYSA